MISIPSVNSDWGHFSITRDGKNIDFPIYLPDSEIFNHDPSFLIRLKCVALTGITPLVTLIRSIEWIKNAAFGLLEAAFKSLDGQKVKNSRLSNIKLLAIDSARAWAYGIPMTTVVALGILFPYKARLIYGRLERRLNRHTSYHRDKFYSAVCFQPIYKLTADSDSKKIAVAKLEKYLARIDNAKARRPVIIWKGLSCQFSALVKEIRAL